jgi:hypothetical protein
VAHDFNVELGTFCRSDAVAREGDTPLHDDPRKTFGRPGSRAPHLWLERNGARVSTLDLFGRPFVVLAGPEGAGWAGAARTAAAAISGLELDVHAVGAAGLRDPDGRFAEAYGLAPSGAALVRPDGVVAWRERAFGPGAADRLAAALRSALRRG